MTTTGKPPKPKKNYVEQMYCKRCGVKMIKSANGDYAEWECPECECEDWWDDEDFEDCGRPYPNANSQNS